MSGKLLSREMMDYMSGLLCHLGYLIFVSPLQGWWITRKFMVIYIDDILLFSKSKEYHLKYLENILSILHEHKMMINLEKCEFMNQDLVYLISMISKGCLKMDPSKIDAILNWTIPRTRREVRSFHGMAKF